MNGWRDDVKFFNLDFEQASQYGGRLIELWGREADRYDARHAKQDKRRYRLCLVVAACSFAAGINFLVLGFFW